MHYKHEGEILGAVTMAFISRTQDFLGGKEKTQYLFCERRAARIRVTVTVAHLRVRTMRVH